MSGWAKATLKPCLHWVSLSSIMPATATRDSVVLALATLGGMTKNRNDPISL